ncbi:MAG: hypothetical protein FD161_3753 [Limisphaerales bacterium]|nr:MAG: hypothetical protein FD161_3753 [Limisphaerales bacterium]KAG0507498.1 MAG: hypothetical protein E1N63_3350 [Limisphaerales bacterium]TXT50703.1 MAG: hypothetical protein FD140_2175 [Limisphaerales bacterium]
MKKLALLAAALVAFGGLASNATAQEQRRGGFNPEEMRARMAERMRELLDVKNDDEWKLISARLEKVTEAQREVRSLNGDMRLLFSRSGDQGGQGGGDNNRSRGPGGPGGSLFGGTPNPDAEAFSKAVQNKAPTEELKQRMARVREARKNAEAKYEKAADDLRQVLTVRQEATLVAIGTLK